MESFKMADEIRIVGNETILPASSVEVHALWLPAELYPQFPNLRDHSGANMPFNDKKQSDINTLHSIKSFDFPSLYTNLPLDFIFHSLKYLIIKNYVNRKSLATMVNPHWKSILVYFS